MPAQFTVNKFLWWAWWQSLIMILQNRWASLLQGASSCHQVLS